MKKTQRSSHSSRRRHSGAATAAGTGEQAVVAAGEPLAAELQGGKVGICLTADKSGYRRSKRGAGTERTQS